MYSRPQARKLARLLPDAKANVPLYSRLYANIDLEDAALTPIQLLKKLPILSKSDLLSTSRENRLNRRFDPATLIEESTTGSTGQPFALHVDKSYVRRRNLRFLHGLLSTGFRPWRRIMLLTDRYSDSTRAGCNRSYVSVEQSTTNILDAYIRIQPHALYGFLTPLKLLAEKLLDSARTSLKPQLVISTAEMLDPHSKRLLKEAFGCPVTDFYGLTEMGLVAWKRPNDPVYSILSNSVLTELIPESPANNRYKIVMTNLDLQSSPIIRYDCGDMARAELVDGKLAVVAIEGRRVDALAHRDGSIVSPYRVTDGLRDIPGLRQFKITQRNIDELEIDLDAARHRQEQVKHDVIHVIESLLGDNVKISTTFKSRIIPDSAQKFRPVTSLVRKS